MFSLFFLETILRQKFLIDGILTYFVLQCASSSMQNIFFRFGERNHLNIVLPRGGYHIGSKVSYIQL